MFSQFLTLDTFNEFISSVFFSMLADCPIPVLLTIIKPSLVQPVLATTGNQQPPEKKRNHSKHNKGCMVVGSVSVPFRTRGWGPRFLFLGAKRTMKNSPVDQNRKNIHMHISYFILKRARCRQGGGGRAPAWPPTVAPKMGAARRPPQPAAELPPPDVPSSWNHLARFERGASSLTTLPTYRCALAGAKASSMFQLGPWAKKGHG